MGPDLRLVIILVRYKVCWTGAQRKQARPFVAGFVVRRSAGGERVSANFRESRTGEVRRMHQAVEKVVIRPVDGPKQNPNT